MRMRGKDTFQAGDRVRLREDHLGLKSGARGTVVRIRNAWAAGAAARETGRTVFVRFDRVYGIVGIDPRKLAQIERLARGGDAAAAYAMLREMVELFGDRPYQALGKTGPYICVFCGETTERERRPRHMSDCPWPSVLALMRKPR
jgi:hypothetical protein